MSRRTESSSAQILAEKDTDPAGKPHTHVEPLQKYLETILLSLNLAAAWRQGYGLWRGGATGPEPPSGPALQR